jgi:hypothetical protein
MRALVNGAVNDKPTKILLDSGANISAVSVQFAKRLRLMKKARHDMEINVQGIGKSKVPTMARITVKVTLGWQIVYEFDVWIMDHHAGVDLILGTDFMIPAGIRLDLFNSTAKLPDEVVIPLLKSQSAEQCTPSYGSEVVGGPPESLTIPSRCTAEFRLSKRAPSTTTHELWIRRTKDWIPTAIHNSRGRKVKVLVTNVSDRLIWCPAHFPVVVWIPHGELPADNGYVRLNSAKYGDWQVLVYETAIDKTLLVKEQQLYQAWLDRQPPAVEKNDYEVPTGVKTREQPLGEGERLTCAEQWELELSRRLSSEEDESDSGSSFSSSQSDEPIRLGDAAELSGVVRPTQSPGAITTPSTGSGAPRQIHTAESMNSAVSVMSREGLSDAKAEFVEQATRLKSMVDNDDSANHRFNKLLQHEIAGSEATFSDDPATDLELRFLAAMSTCEDAEAVDTDSAAAPLPSAEYEHSATEVDLEDYAHELEFLPDMTDLEATFLDYTGSNMVSEAHTPDEQARLVAMLQTHEYIMISSGNALPPPAYGVVCDIDVEDHRPIKQRARRTPLKHLKKLYELLKGLLKAGLIAFSNSPWASPIVIVLKKNGVDIRLCIDYKMVNAITKLMEYAMPLVDDLLTRLEHYLCFLLTTGR